MDFQLKIKWLVFQSLKARVVQKNEQRSKFRNTWTKRLFAKSFLCKFGALAYVVKINVFVVRWQKWLVWRLGAAILHNTSYNYTRYNKTRRRQPKVVLL